MKFSITSYNAVAVWKWDTHPSSSEQHKLYHYAKSPSIGDGNGYGYSDDEDEDEDDEEDDVCGICRLAFESTCPECKIPGDDCPLIWGECTHVFHMHCLLKWIDTESSKGQCPMDRRPWETMDRAPDRLPTTTTGEPVATVPSGPIPNANTSVEHSTIEAQHGAAGIDPAQGGDEAARPDAESEDASNRSGSDEEMDVDEGEAELHPASVRV